MLKLMFLLAMFFALALPVSAHAAPAFLGEVPAESVKLAIYDEPCSPALKKLVSNLPFRITWTEKGKITEGCAGPRIDQGVVMAFFGDDRTVVALPIDLFAPVIAL